MKTALITGGGRGIGLGFTKYLLKHDFRVIVGVRDPAKVTQKLGKNENLLVVKLDLTSDESIKAAAVKVAQLTNHLDYLINNAGLNKDTATGGHKELVCNLLTLDRSSLHKLFDVNTIAPLIMVKEFIPLLARSPNAFIINISSGRSSLKDEYPNTNGNYGYRSSKAALNMMTYASTYDLPPNVHTFAVHPGGVKTDMNPTGEHDAETQAGKIMAITENWKQEFNGQFLRFDGTLYPL